jgi:two-component system, chemotaxis family, sensor kinase Cph1
MGGDIRFGQVDLTTCDREPIHIPGSIQPHGVLLVFDRHDLSVRRAAGDTQFLLGVPMTNILQVTLHGLLDDRALALVRERLLVAGPNVGMSVVLDAHARSGAMPIDLTLHATGDTAVIEVEPARRTVGERGDPLAQIKAMLAAVQAADGLEACAAVAAAQVRSATGFARVMVYRFLEDGSGSVIAEDRAADMDSFLGLHFPASDVPHQARELYRRNWLRTIPDVDYVPMPLYPAADPRTVEPFDMTHCMLRSVSPTHREYLRAMGVAASMSISIVLGGRLWGLVACHDRIPRYVAADLRIACELFAQMFSLQVEAKEGAHAAQRRFAALPVHEDLVHRVALAQRVGPELTRDDALLELVAADGAAVWLDGELSIRGDVPPREFLLELVTWLTGRATPVFHTDHLAVAYPPARAHAATACGLLAMSLSRGARDFVLWFRAELVRTVTWAGDPNKPAEPGPGQERLSPRKSFAAWVEEVRGRAVPWEDVDLEAARALRVMLLETVLLQSDLARQERESAEARQNLLMAELDHRVKNTLANIQALVRQTKVGKTSLEEYATALESRIRAMAQAHSLLSEARWAGATLRRLLEEELAPYRRIGIDRCRLEGEDFMLSPDSALPLSLVVHELTTNAVKYGSLSVPQGRLVVQWRIDRARNTFLLEWTERDGPVVPAPARRGFGSIVIERSVEYELKGTASLDFPPEGLVCRIEAPFGHLKATPGGPPSGD